MTNYTFLSADVFETITEDSLYHRVDAMGGGFHILVGYSNGFTASITKNAVTSGSSDLWEIAVLYNNEICHRTSITDGIVAYLDDEGVLDYCNRIRDLDLAEL